MTAKQEAKLSMYDAVIQQANTSPAIPATIPAFQTALTAFTAKYSSIVAAAQLEQAQITGVAIDKSVARKNLAQQAADIAASIFALAAAAGNNTLREEARLPISRFTNMRDELVSPTCQGILNLANTNLAALAPYGINAATLTLFQASITSFETVAAKPRNAVSQRVAYRETIKTLFKEADDILKNQLDKIAPQFKAANIEYYNAYTTNREILDPAVSATQVQGVVLNLADLSPLQGVQVAAQEKPYTAISAIDGTYTLKTPKPGTYTLQFSKTGFATKSEQVQTTLGNTVEKDVSLTAV